MKDDDARKHFFKISRVKPLDLRDLKNQKRPPRKHARLFVPALGVGLSERVVRLVTGYVMKERKTSNSNLMFSVKRTK